MAKKPSAPPARPAFKESEALASFRRAVLSERVAASPKFTKPRPAIRKVFS
jgi:hypothetical protein